MPKKIHRRQMLKRSAAAGAGTWLFAQGLNVRAAEANEKLNVAVIGLGGQGRANLGGVSGENVVALCDVDDVRAGQAYEKFPKAKKFYDFREMLDKVEKQIDAVVVSTPDHTHAHIALDAMRRGKHCYCEKPMAHDVTAIRAMCDVAREKNLATQLGVQRHTIENMHRVVELIKGGAIGEVREVHSWVGGDRGMPAMPTEFPAVPSTLKWDLWLGPAADRRYTPDYVPYKWRFWWDFGTGEMGNWGCHILDIPYWALDLKHCTKVSATGPEVDPQRTPKSMAVRYEFPQRGNLPPVTLHWSHTKNAEILKKYNLSSKGANNLFIGSKGMLLCGFGSRKLLPEDKFADFEAPEPTIPKSPGFHKEWITACKGGEPATCNFDYSGPMAETVILGNVAYRVGGEGFGWDAAELKQVGCPAAEQYIRPKYRDGWPL